MMRHSCEYMLIGQIGLFDETAIDPVGLYRLSPGRRVPKGFVVVVSIKGHSVYDEDGMLEPCYKSLKRYIILNGILA